MVDEQKLAQFEHEEKEIKEENLRLQRRLLLEQERREALSRHLSESESSLEMDDERQFNEMTAHGLRPRTISSPIPYSPNPNNRPISPGKQSTTHEEKMSNLEQCVYLFEECASVFCIKQLHF